VTEHTGVFDAAHALMQTGVRDGVFPGGVLRVLRQGEAVFTGAYGVCDLTTRRPVSEATFFDLASLTKPLATTLAVMRLVQQERLDLAARLGDLLPAWADAPGARISVAALLDHSSGLAAWRPYYKDTDLSRPAARRREALTRRLAAEAPGPAGDTLYSDLGFMILCRVVESVSGRRLDRFVAREIYRPLGIETLFFIESDTGAGARPGDYAATEVCAWRGGLVRARVHDENAFAAGGIEGHAGLFGDAGAVGQLLAQLMDDYGGGRRVLFPPDLLRRFFTPRRPGGRPLGFDRPDAENSSSGRFFPPHSVGHLGFTGTSFWMDPRRAVAVVLLTNRIHPTRQNERIRAFRPRLHDAVMRALA